MFRSKRLGDRAANSVSSLEPLIVYAVALLGIAAAYLFVFIVLKLDNNLLRGDQVLWARDLVLPVVNGEMSLIEAVTYEFSAFSHSHVLTLILHLIDFHFFDYNLATDYVVGTAALAGTAVYLGLRLERETGPRTLLTGMAALILFSIQTPAYYAWSLLVVSNYTIFMAVVSVVEFSRALGDRQAFYRHIFIATPLLVVFGGGLVVAAVLAQFLFLAFEAVRRNVPAAQCAAYLAVIIFTNLLFDAMLAGSRIHSSTSLVDFVYYTVHNPGAVAHAVLILLARVWGVGASNAVTLGVFSLLTIGLVLSLAWHAITNKSISVSNRASLILAIASLIWMAGVVKSRLVGNSPDYMNAPRYEIYLRVFLLALILFRFRDVARAKSTLLAAGLAAYLTVAVLPVQADAARHANRRYLEVRIDAMHDYPQTAPETIGEYFRHCSNRRCDALFEMLRERNKNVFHDPAED